MDTYFLIGSDDRIYELPADKSLTIGRSPINKIVLNDRIASRVHATIAASAKGPLLTDRESANGTYINGRRVQEAILGHGDTIRISRFLFEVMRGSRADAEQWVARRKSATHTDQTITDLNVNQLRDTDMVGDLSAFQIIPLLQTLVDQRRPGGGLFLTRAGQRLGEIYFTNGNIVYAETATGLKGKIALFELMALTQGQFTFRNEARPPMLAIMEEPSLLILEGCQRLDEQRAAK